MYSPGSDKLTEVQLYTSTSCQQGSRVNKFYWHGRRGKGRFDLQYMFTIRKKDSDKFLHVISYNVFDRVLASWFSVWFILSMSIWNFDAIFKVPLFQFTSLLIYSWRREPRYAPNVNRWLRRGIFIKIPRLNHLFTFAIVSKTLLNTGLYKNNCLMH